MEGISDIKIVGIDELRPPRIRKEPYITINFKLSHKVPEKWCDIFNTMVSKRKYQTKIEPENGLFIDTWVRNSGEIAVVLDDLKGVVKAVNEEFIERMRLEAEKAAHSGSRDNPEDEGEQGRLNRIIAGLNFDD